MKVPARVKNCVTHHHACDCGQWKADERERALKTIAMWVDIWREFPSVRPDLDDMLEVIDRKANKALGLLGD